MISNMGTTKTEMFCTKIICSVRASQSCTTQTAVPAATTAPRYDPLGRLTAFTRGTLSSSGNNGSVLGTVSMRPIPPSRVCLNAGFLSRRHRQPDPVTTDGTPTGRTQNGQNELTGVGRQSTLTFDNNGNTTTDENGNTLTYDAWNRLISDSAGTTSYTYDADGRRITETHSGTTTDVYFDSQGQVIEEQHGGTVTNQYVWNIEFVNDLLLRDDNSPSGSLGITGSGLGERLYVQHDANYDVTAITNTSGAVQERFVESPYGVVTAVSSSWTAIGGWTVSGDTYHWLYYFQGGRYDASTGLVRFGDRDYDVLLGVWAEPDPTGYGDGADRYFSDLDDPIALLDPTGENAVVVPREICRC